MAIIGLSALLLGCSVDLPVKELPPTLFLGKYGTPAGTLISKHIIDAEDPVYQNLSWLLAEHQSGWDVAYASYAPGLYILRSDGLSIGVYNDMILINKRINERYVSVKKNIPGVAKLLGLQDGT